MNGPANACQWLFSASDVHSAWGLPAHPGLGLPTYPGRMTQYESGPDTASAALVLEAWHRAVNDADVDTAVGWCADDVAVQGPRGTGHGQDLMRAWLLRSRIRLQPQGEFAEVDGRVVIRELAQWTAADAPADAPTDDPVETWCVFTVSDGLVTSVARYETESEIPPVDPAV